MSDQNIAPAIHERKGHTPGELNEAQRSALSAISKAFLAGDIEVAHKMRDDLRAYERAMGLMSAYEAESREAAEKRHKLNAVRNAAPELLETLKACRAQFDFYAAEHRKSEKHEKAATNERFAFLCSEAITKAEG